MVGKLTFTRDNGAYRVLYENSSESRRIVGTMEKGVKFPRVMGALASEENLPLYNDGLKVEFLGEIPRGEKEAFQRVIGLGKIAAEGIDLAGQVIPVQEESKRVERDVGMIARNLLATTGK